MKRSTAASTKTLPKRSRKIQHAQPHLDKLSAEFRELDENGYMVVPNILTHEECDKAREGINKWFESIGVRPTHPEDWSPQNLPRHNYFMFQNFSVPYIQAVMDVRQHPKVHSVFSTIWGDKQLWSSLDAICVQPPYEWRNQPPPQPKTWFHFDQGRKKLQRQCIQGFVTLEDMNSDDATLLVLEKSHLYHKTYFEEFPDGDNTDWVRFTAEQEAWVRRQPQVFERRVAAPKGSMVLWDSRTAHCSGQPLAQRKNPHWRYVVYTCQMPYRFATSSQWAKKRKAFADRRTTNHYPLESHLFGKASKFPTWKPGRWELPPVDYSVQLTPLGKELFAQ